MCLYLVLAVHGAPELHEELYQFEVPLTGSQVQRREALFVLHQVVISMHD